MMDRGLKIFNPSRNENIFHQNVECAYNLNINDTTTVWGKIELLYIGAPQKITLYELEAVKINNKLKRQRESIQK